MVAKCGIRTLSPLSEATPAALLRWPPASLPTVPVSPLRLSVAGFVLRPPLAWIRPAASAAPPESPVADG
jgi:hypothetical protein